MQFPAGGTTLSPAATGAVKHFASKRGSAGIAVIGYGDAASTGPEVQTVALGLGLARAQAIANALTSHGVPASVIRVGSEATGRGASLRLLP